MRPTLRSVRSAIVRDPDNAWATDQGWQPLYSAHPDAKIVIVGQAPGRRAQLSGTPWDDEWHHARVVRNAAAISRALPVST